PLGISANAPPWLRDSLQSLMKVDLGCHYVSVLAALVRLEEAAGFEVADRERKRLPTTKRPKQIADWIRGGQGTKSKKTPEVKSASKYAQSWNEWWDPIQPSWRTRDLEGHWAVGGDYGKDWTELDCSGANGCLSVVAGLYFWGVAAKGSSEDERVWDNAVQDA
ncbi:hypothetical protein B0H17DRAFT_908374, partial [Mycena rosella]